MGNPIGLRLAVVEFSQKIVTLVDVDSLRVLDGKISLKRYVRHVQGSDSLHGNAIVTSETFNCMQNTISRNSFSIQGYVTDDLYSKSLPMSKSLVESDNLSSRLCDVFLEKPESMSYGELTKMLRGALLKASDSFIPQLPYTAFSLKEIFIDPQYDSKGKLITYEKTPLLSYYLSGKH